MTKLETTQAIALRRLTESPEWKILADLYLAMRERWKSQLIQFGGGDDGTDRPRKSENGRTIGRNGTLVSRDPKQNERVGGEMTEETKGPDISDAIDRISKKLDEKSVADLERFSSLENKLDAKAMEDFSFDDEEPEKKTEDEKPVSRSELKRVTEEAIKKATETATKVADERTELRAQRQNRDMEVMGLFPELNQGNPEFNKKFYDAVGEDMRRRIKGGRAPEDMDLLYDSAATVAIKGRKEGWLKTPLDAERSLDERARRSESFQVRKTAPQDNDKPSDRQIELAKKLGLPQERLASHWAKTTKSLKTSVDSDW